MNLPKIYIEEIYNTGGGRLCTACKKPSIKGFCEKHLKKARLYFRSWVQKRYSKGLCYQCNRKHYKDEQRCPLHKRLNQLKCLKWTRKK